MKAPALLRSYLLVGTRTIYTVRIRARCVRTSFPQRGASATITIQKKIEIRTRMSKVESSTVSLVSRTSGGRASRVYHRTKARSASRCPLHITKLHGLPWRPYIEHSHFEIEPERRGQRGRWVHDLYYLGVLMALCVAMTGPNPSIVTSIYFGGGLLTIDGLKRGSFLSSLMKAFLRRELMSSSIRDTNWLSSSGSSIWRRVPMVPPMKSGRLTVCCASSGIFDSRAAQGGKWAVSWRLCAPVSGRRYMYACLSAAARWQAKESEPGR
jgi:hypothetical protein